MSLCCKAECSASIRRAVVPPILIISFNDHSASSPQSQVSRNAFRLSGRLRVFWALKEDVIPSIAIERRVQIDQIDARIIDVLSQNFEIVAEIELVHKVAPPAAGSLRVVTSR